MSQRPIMIAAGGTGGHLFPAQALSEALIARGYAVELITDDRVAGYGASFPARRVHRVPAATPSGGSILARARAIVTLIRGTQAARKIIRAVKPRALVGFGGYPTVPPVLAAAQLKVPTILHEQNAVMGRANKFLAGRVKAVAKGFDHLACGNARIEAKTYLTGNPVRPSVIQAARRPYPGFQGGVLRLLVTGGSQGARVMSDIVPAAIALMTPEERARLRIVQQARGEDEARVRRAYAALGVEAEVESFFTDLPDRISEAHLVIGRAGASTVSELAVIGRPSILVPLPHALDQDQAANAAVLEKAGAALVIKQALFTPEWLADTIRQAMLDREGLAAQAFAARRTGIADAAERLADLVERLMSPEEPE
ncbi:MAG: undecaprenyldiphospho-muramoylpentapeptide beta-N-acetylglucosaminyltransferase [Beijerinckiaceae bacterium]|jgi:UDP-N-acetylglucosamine--N-acetylmuramyl-(pentapeptide) pyrophosphoryl-undecaprenol N-acetylglucosamine transferase